MVQQEIVKDILHYVTYTGIVDHNQSSSCNGLEH